MTRNIHMTLCLDGADAVPLATIGKELKAHLSGSTVRMRNEDGSFAAVVIDEAMMGVALRIVEDES